MEGHNFREEMARGTSHPLSFLSPPSLFIALSLSHLCLSPVGCRLEAPTASSTEYSSGHATGLVVELHTFPSDSTCYWSRLVRSDYPHNACSQIQVRWVWRPSLLGNGFVQDGVEQLSV